LQRIPKFEQSGLYTPKEHTIPCNPDRAPNDGLDRLGTGDSSGRDRDRAFSTLKGITPRGFGRRAEREETYRHGRFELDSNLGNVSLPQ